MKRIAGMVLIGMFVVSSLIQAETIRLKIETEIVFDEEGNYVSGKYEEARLTIIDEANKKEKFFIERDVEIPIALLNMNYKEALESIAVNIQ